MPRFWLRLHVQLLWRRLPLPLAIGGDDDRRPEYEPQERHARRDGDQCPARPGLVGRTEGVAETGAHHEDQIHQRDEQRATEELEGHIGARGERPDGLPRLMTRIAAEQVDRYPPQQAVALPLVARVLTQRTML